MEPMGSYSAYQVAAHAPVGERMSFLRKIYGLLTLSILIAFSSATFVLGNEAVLQFVFQTHLFFFIAEIAAIFFVFWARHKQSVGLIALFGFTGLTGVTTAPLIFAYQNVAGQAAALTLVIFVSLSLYAVFTKRDLSFLSGLLFSGLMILIFGGLLNAFFFHSSAASFMFSSFAVFLFSGFILYDTQNILKRYPTDEYISATLALYVDILNLFVHLLFLLGGQRD